VPRREFRERPQTAALALDPCEMRACVSHPRDLPQRRRGHLKCQPGTLPCSRCTVAVVVAAVSAGTAARAGRGNHTSHPRAGEAEHGLGRGTHAQGARAARAGVFAEHASTPRACVGVGITLIEADGPRSGAVGPGFRRSAQRRHTRGCSRGSGRLAASASLLDRCSDERRRHATVRGRGAARRCAEAAEVRAPPPATEPALHRSCRDPSSARLSARTFGSRSY
jgi:hypothetical protein